jgi:hypothetical protein
MNNRYTIQAVSYTGCLDYKGEGMGKDRNFSNDGSRENEEYESLENAIYDAEKLSSEFDECWEIHVTEDQYFDDWEYDKSVVIFKIKGMKEQ